MDPQDAKLKAFLRESRVSPPLPPRFRENVWRRIEDAESPSPAGLSTLEALAAMLLRPRFAYAAATLLVLLGLLLGAYEGSRSARADAEARYVSVVAPNSLR